MTLRLRVLNNSNGLMIADTFAKSAKVTFGLNKSVDWSAEFPVATEAVKLISTGLRVEIYYLGVLINTGVVQDFTQEDRFPQTAKMSRDKLTSMLPRKIRST